jgi:hypothetical protein
MHEQDERRPFSARNQILDPFVHLKKGRLSDLGREDSLTGWQIGKLSHKILATLDLLI